jgi:hypothetical protein
MFFSYSAHSYAHRQAISNAPPRITTKNFKSRTKTREPRTKNIYIYIYNLLCVWGGALPFYCDFFGALAAKVRRRPYMCHILEYWVFFAHVHVMSSWARRLALIIDFIYGMLGLRHNNSNSRECRAGGAPSSRSGLSLSGSRARAPALMQMRARKQGRGAAQAQGGPGARQVGRGPTEPAAQAELLRAAQTGLRRMC